MRTAAALVPERLRPAANLRHLLSGFHDSLARKMRANGEHLRTIAMAVKSDLQTVKGWLEE